MAPAATSMVPRHPPTSGARTVGATTTVTAVPSVYPARATPLARARRARGTCAASALGIAGAQKPMCMPKTSIAAASDHGPVAQARAAHAAAPASSARAATRRGPKRSTAAPPTSDASAIPSDAAPHTNPPIACEIPSSFAIDGMSGGSTDHPSPPPTACAIAQSAVVRPGIVRSIAHLSLRRNTTGAPPSMSPSSPPVKRELLQSQHGAPRYVPPGGDSRS